MFLYGIAIRIYVFCLYLVSPFYVKARKAVEGRMLQPEVKRSGRFIWFHCASLGEFEQGRPLIEKLRTTYPGKKILLSFFSPSGYEVRKNYDGADEVIYIPFDSTRNAKKLLRQFDVEMALIVKNDVWPFFLKALLAKKIPVFLVSTVFRNNQFYFKGYGSFLKRMLQQVNSVFVQDENSKSIAEQHGFTNVSVSGDVRIDRVLEIKRSIQPIAEIERFLEGKPCVIFASLHYEDVPVLDSFMHAHPDAKIIIVPHEIGECELQHWKQKYANSIVYGDLSNYHHQNQLIIDHVGSLNKLYQYASLVYIGGGFGSGIHNILEPAAFGNLIYIGPRYSKFPEAVSMVENGLIFSSDSKAEIANAMIANRESGPYAENAKKLQDWFDQHQGATSLIFKAITTSF